MDQKFFGPKLFFINILFYQIYYQKKITKILGSQNQISKTNLWDHPMNIGVPKILFINIGQKIFGVKQI